MKSEFLSMFGIPPTECEIEVRKDDLGVPRLWFRSTGNLPVGLDLTGAMSWARLSEQISASISGASAEVRLPSGEAAW